MHDINNIGLLLSLVGGGWICTLIYFVLSGTIVLVAINSVVVFRLN